MYQHTWRSPHTKQYIYGELYTHKVEEANKEKKLIEGGLYRRLRKVYAEVR